MKNNQPKHTPTPWDYSGEFIKTFDNKTIIAEVQTGDDICHDSEFIVRAVNSHDMLLDAAKRALRELEQRKEGADERYALRNAIALAEGK